MLAVGITISSILSGACRVHSGVSDHPFSWVMHNSHTHTVTTLRTCVCVLRLPQANFPELTEEGALEIVIIKTTGRYMQLTETKRRNTYADPATLLVCCVPRLLGCYPHS